MKMKMKAATRFVLVSAALLLRFSYAFSSTQSSSYYSSKSHYDGSGLIRLRPGSANDELRRLLKEQQINDIEGDGAGKYYPPSQVILEGVVSKRRVIGKHLVFVDVVPMQLPIFPTRKSTTRKKNSTTIYDEIESIAPVHAILMRDYWNHPINENYNTSSCSYDIYHKIIQPGVHVQLTGHVGSSRNDADGAIVFCHTTKYILLNNNPQHLQTVLRYAKEGMLDMNELINAIPCLSRDELTANHSLSELATEVLDRFPRNYLFDPSRLMGSTNRQKLNLLPLAPPEYMTTPSFGIDRNDFGAVHKSAHFEASTRAITVSGMVQNRRRYQGSITVLTLVQPVLLEESSDDVLALRSTEAESQRLCVVLHPDVLTAGDDSNINSIKLSQAYGNMLCSGARLLVQGYMTGGSVENAPTMWSTSCRILQSSWRPNAVRQVLDMLHEGKIAVDEAADALKLPGGYNQAEDIAKGTTSVTERQWLAAELTQSLQGKHSLLGKVTASMEQSLVSFAYAREKYPVEHVSLESEFDLPPEVNSVVQSSDGNHRSSTGSRWQRAKEPQLKFMIKQIGTVLRSHPDYGRRKLKVVDIGGGKGLLSNLLAELFGDTVEVQVVDISQSATNNGMMRAKRRGLQNIQYTAADATAIDIEGVDVVVALHACGALADVALGHAVSHGAGFVVCPCCYLSNSHLRVSVPNADIPRTKLSTVEEWLMVDPIQYEQLKRTAEVQGDIKLASEAMHTVCGLRSLAVHRLWQGSRWPSAELGLTVKIKRFPVAFSTRNFCLVGSFNRNHPPPG
ncbi:hypothetical protein ACHAXH_009637 [Discostella pseudostelligera]